MGIHGAALAGGCALLGGADIVVAQRGTKLGYPVVKIGVSPAVSAPFLSANVRDGAARSLMLDPGIIDADRALTLGLVHEVLDSQDGTLERASAVARGLASKPGRGVAATKALVNELCAARTDRADLGLSASLSRTGSDEERAMLSALWGN